MKYVIVTCIKHDMNVIYIHQYLFHCLSCYHGYVPSFDKFILHIHILHLFPAPLDRYYDLFTQEYSCFTSARGNYNFSRVSKS